MIAACPICGARYRIDTTKLRPEGARLRCSRCESVFRVREPAAADASPSGEQRPVAPVPVAPVPPAAPAAPVAPVPPAVPAAASAPVFPAAPANVPTPAADPERVVVASSWSEAPADAPAADRERLVLVAHPETEAGKQVADALASWGFRSILVHDGVEAILNIQRALPRVVVLDAALPKMFGFQVCELMKRNESLRTIRVILIGAIHDQGRYRRPPGDLYGADEYLERQQLPDGLVPLLSRFGMEVGAPPAPAATELPPPPIESASPPPRAPPPQPVGNAPSPELPPPQPVGNAPSPELPPPPEITQAPVREVAPSVGVAPPVAEGPPAASADPALAAEIEQADRLARIIVSDVVIYNPEKFEAGLRDGDVVEALASELSEGHALFAQRVDPRVGDPSEFLRKELLRVAQSRGMK